MMLLKPVSYWLMIVLFAAVLQSLYVHGKYSYEMVFIVTFPFCHAPWLDRLYCAVCWQ